MTHREPLSIAAAAAQTSSDQDESRPQFLRLQSGVSLAYRLRRAQGEPSGPGVVWLGGFRSDMKSLKVTRLDQWAAGAGRDCLRFDYSGHGESGGDFEQGTIGAWTQEGLEAVQALTRGPQILVGSSMGGWIALLLARALAKSGQGGRLAGLVLIAPAVDFTEALIWARLPQETRDQIERDGRWLRASDYSADPHLITRNLIEEGRRHLLLGESINVGCPVHILQGMQDPDVPWRHTMTLLEHLAGDPAVLTLVKDGDHRLSRESDLQKLIAAVEGLC